VAVVAVAAAAAAARAAEVVVLSTDCRMTARAVEMPAPTAAEDAVATTKLDQAAATQVPFLATPTDLQRTAR